MCANIDPAYTYTCTSVPWQRVTRNNIPRVRAVPEIAKQSGRKRTINITINSSFGKAVMSRRPKATARALGTPTEASNTRESGEKRDIGPREA